MPQAEILRMDLGGRENAFRMTGLGMMMSELSTYQRQTVVNGPAGMLYMGSNGVPMFGRGNGGSYAVSGVISGRFAWPHQLVDGGGAVTFTIASGNLNPYLVYGNLGALAFVGGQVDTTVAFNSSVTVTGRTGAGGGDLILTGTIGGSLPFASSGLENTGTVIIEGGTLPANSTPFCVVNASSNGIQFWRVAGGVVYNDLAQYIQVGTVIRYAITYRATGWPS